MNRWTLFSWIGVVVLTGVLAGCDAGQPPPSGSSEQPGAARQDFTLAVVPYISPPHLFDAFSPLASYLEDAIGKTVRIRTAANFDEFMARTLEQRYDLVISNPFLFLTLRKQGGYEPLVADGRPFQSVLIVPADSPAKTLADLRGKRIGVLSEKALAGHLLPVDLLQSAGLQKDRDYTAVVMASFDLILTALLNGEIAAGAFWLAQYEDYGAETRSQTRILAMTDQYGGDPYAVRGDLPMELREALRSALLRLHEQPGGERLLKAIGVQRFVVADEADYDGMQQFADRNRLAY